MRLDRYGDKPAHRFLKRLRGDLRQLATDKLHNFLIMTIDDGGDERLFARVILVKRANAHARLFSDSVGAGSVETFPDQNASCRFNKRVNRKWFMPESKFKKHLIEQARIRSGQRVLDLGCGTATLTILIKQAHPHAEVTGLDGDAKILKIACRKVARAGVDITLHEGLAYQLPDSDKSFDRVVSSLVLHHLTAEDRRRALSEAFRVLQPGGELHIADLGRPNKLLPTMLRDAGFEQDEELSRYATIFGDLLLWRARRPVEAVTG